MDFNPEDFREWVRFLVHRFGNQSADILHFLTYECQSKGFYVSVEKGLSYPLFCLPAESRKGCEKLCASLR